LTTALGRRHEDGVDVIGHFTEVHSLHGAISAPGIVDF
jgi:hypothetical protein